MKHFFSFALLKQNHLGYKSKAILFNHSLEMKARACAIHFCLTKIIIKMNSKEEENKRQNVIYYFEALAKV